MYPIKPAALWPDRQPAATQDNPLPLRQPRRFAATHYPQKPRRRRRHGFCKPPVRTRLAFFPSEKLQPRSPPPPIFRLSPKDAATLAGRWHALAAARSPRLTVSAFLRFFVFHRRANFFKFSQFYLYKKDQPDMTPAKILKPAPNANPPIKNKNKELNFIWIFFLKRITTTGITNKRKLTKIKAICTSLVNIFRKVGNKK